MQESGRSYYEILGVDREASRDEIRRAYREIAQVYHPDSHFFSEIIEQKVSDEQMRTFKDVTAAYHVLMNEDSRRRYDETLPPHLRDWEGDSDLKIPRSKIGEILSEPGRPSVPFAFGTFGVTGDAPLNREPDPDESKVRAMSEIIEIRQSIFRRLLNKLGF